MSKKNLAPSPSETNLVSSDKLHEKVKELYCFAIGLPHSQREGVFVYSFICNECELRLNVYSLKASRHHEKNVYCPECGIKGNFRYLSVVICLQ